MWRVYDLVMHELPVYSLLLSSELWCRVRALEDSRSQNILCSDFRILLGQSVVRTYIFSILQVDRTAKNLAADYGL